jgi:hypothetical protein
MRWTHGRARFAMHYPLYCWCAIPAATTAKWQASPPPNRAVWPLQLLPRTGLAHRSSLDNGECLAAGDPAIIGIGAMRLLLLDIRLHSALGTPTPSFYRFTRCVSCGTERTPRLALKVVEVRQAIQGRSLGLRYDSEVFVEGSHKGGNNRPVEFPGSGGGGVRQSADCHHHCWSPFAAKRVRGGSVSISPCRTFSLRKVKALQREDASAIYVFVSERKAPLTPHALRKIVARAGRQAGVASWHAAQILLRSRGKREERWDRMI